MDGGRLVIRLAWRGGRLVEVAGRTHRPAAAGLLRGKTPAQAQALVPLLFSLCGRAQQAVCRAACGAATGMGPPPAAASRRALLAEAGQEHLWRLLLDWPRLLGVPAGEAAFAAWHRRLAAWAREGGEAAADAAGQAMPAPAAGHRRETSCREAATAFAGFLQDTLLGVSAADFLAGTPPAGEALAGQLLAALPPWPALSGAVPPRLLPRRAAMDWATDPALADAGFALAPEWAGAPAETGALARQQGRPAVVAALADGQGLRARLLARLCDLAELPVGLAGDKTGAAPGRAAVWLEAASAQPGSGLACTDTARGLLIHWLRLADGRIADYRVVAPSEWNFHPAGQWRRELAGLPTASPAAAEARARQLALALDPCVPLDLEVTATENDHA
jgi:uptake hydrogenase large subunit